jgi:transcriptional regulator with XRE-family HTH domain
MGTQASPLGAGELILVARELTGMSQRGLATAVGTSQPALATLETGNRMPTIRTLLRVAEAAGLELLVGLRHREVGPTPDPETLRRFGIALVGTLHTSTGDGMADFVAMRMPSPFEGPG